ncbi:MAG TPA: flagellar FliJ family protein [Ignavibacteriales bacterium]|nr:flagellar FliJ family protein [Ignavibacteriales bacterium]
MAKFRYKFESIKKIKETFEKKIQKEISLIDLEIEKQNGLLESLAEEKNKSRNSLSGRSFIKISELQFQGEVQNLLGLREKKILNEIANLRKIKETRMLELEQKTKEHKIFETLEEKHYEDFLLVQNQIEQKEIDEIASKKFAREA